MNPSDLPDIFHLEQGPALDSPTDWPAHRQRLLRLMQAEVYGQIPPPPPSVEAVTLQRWKYQEPFAFRQQWVALRPQMPGGLSFHVEILSPATGADFPVLVCGDQNWRWLGNDILSAVLARGYALALFNRVELFPDCAPEIDRTGLRTLFPGGDFGAMAAWAWGYHRVVDFLCSSQGQALGINQARIAITGHSRGGKAVLLAGALDERIAVTAPNNSGCAGAGCFHHGEGKFEKTEDILKNPHWFSKAFGAWRGRDADLPFDQHFLKAAVAPRALLCTESVDDAWANPAGTWVSHRATQELYDFLDAGENLAIWYRRGPHQHTLADWQTLLDFSDGIFSGQRPHLAGDVNPFMAR